MRRRTQVSRTCFGSQIRFSYSDHAQERWSGHKRGGAKSGIIACLFLKDSDPKITSFYGEGELAGPSFVGKGSVHSLENRLSRDGHRRVDVLFRTKRDEGQRGILTTRTVNSRNLLGEKSDPPGYTQPSIATVRLFFCGQESR